MADGNWIKLNRKIWDNFIWNFETPQYALAWIDMLLMANYKDKKILFDGKVKTIPRGSFITSLAKLSERWGMNKRTVKRFLEMLRDDGMITFNCTNKCTAVFISNYNAFQDFLGTECTAECTAECTTECTAECTAECTQHKKIKEGEEGKEGEEASSTVSNDTVCSTDVQRVVDAWNALGLSVIKKITPGTQRDLLLRARIKDYGVDDVLQAIENIKKSTFLQGGGDKGWKIFFDWFIKPNNFPKVLGGNYTDNPKPPAQGRREIVPKWMQPKDTQPSDERIKKSGEWLDEFLSEQEAKEKAEQEARAKADLQTRVETLKKEIAEEYGQK